MNHLRPQNHYAPNLRDWELVERLDTPFDRVAHTVDVGRIASGEGLYSIPNIGIFLWRLGAYSLTRSPAVALDATRFFFSPLGNDTPLFTRPQSEDEITHLAEPLNVPDPISRRILDAHLADYYGPDLSLVLHVDGLEVPIADVHACNLEDDGGGGWAHVPVAGIAIDPELGRIAFPAGQAPETVEVTFHYGFSADMGGGEYERAEGFAELLTPVEPVAAPAAIQDALDLLPAGGAVQIDDSGRYAESLAIDVDPGARLEVRAANGHRPTVVLNGELTIRGGADAEVTLDGLLLTGAALRVPAANNALRRLVLRHCTLVPGLELETDGTPVSPGASSLVVELDDVTVVLDRCIVGAVRAVPGATVEIADSLVDANDRTAVAFADLDDLAAGAVLKVEDTTLVGKVHTRRMEYASNVVFHAALADPDTWTAAVRAEQKQAGCVRFSWVPRPARVPRRYRCQPDLAIEKAVEKALAANPGLTDPQKAALAASVTAGVRARLVPAFTDLRYGRPAYGQLSRGCPVEIRRGADDESEMGAFHDLYQPQRLTNLNVRLQEYLRVGLEAGVFPVT
jgi:hypothetical protein